MYPDPKLVRSCRLTLRLDEYEHDLLTAMANYRGKQLASMARMLAIREAEQLLGMENSVAQPTADRQQEAALERLKSSSKADRPMPDETIAGAMSHA